MSERVVIDTLEALSAFKNEKGFVEIVTRGANKRYKVFYNIAIDNLPQQEQKAVAQKMAELLEKNVANSEHGLGILKSDLAISKKSLNLIGQVAGMSKVGLLLSGLNLCATCAGFAMVLSELNRIERSLSSQIGRLDEDIRKGNDAWSNYEYDKVLSEHNNMLDCFRKQKPYSEEQLRKLVDKEFNVLKLLIRCFENNIAQDNENLMFSIMSLLSMFTAALCYFDEVYFFNNHENIKDGNWHSFHDEWMKIFGKLVEKSFVEKYQDFAIFEKNMNTRDGDLFYIGLLDQIKDLEQQVRDNQDLVKIVGDQEQLHKVREATVEEVKRVILETLQEACSGIESEELKAAFMEAYKQAIAA